MAPSKHKDEILQEYFTVALGLIAVLLNHTDLETIIISARFKTTNETSLTLSRCRTSIFFEVMATTAATGTTDVN